MNWINWKIQTANSPEISTCCGCLIHRLCCNASFHSSWIENCSRSHPTLSMNSKTRSASSTGNVEGVSGNESKISSASGLNTQSTRMTSSCTLCTRQVRHSTIAYARVHRPCEVENETSTFNYIHPSTPISTSSMSTKPTPAPPTVPSIPRRFVSIVPPAMTQ